MQSVVNQRLKIFASATNVSAYQIAKDSGLPESTVYGYFQGKRSIGIDNLAAIAEAYPNLNLNWLVRGTGEMLDRSTLQVERIAA